MEKEEFERARNLTAEGFYYDNLLRMAECCREDRTPGRALSAYVLEKIFLELAAELGDGPVTTGELRKLEARFRTAVNLALEKAIAGAAADEQHRSLSRLIDRLREGLGREDERA